MDKIIKPGSKWWSGGGKFFRVISVTEIEGKTWVYYREDTMSKDVESKEYSCYAESFFQRFSEVPE